MTPLVGIRYELLRRRASKRGREIYEKIGRDVSFVCSPVWSRKGETWDTHTHTHTQCDGERERGWFVESFAWTRNASGEGSAVTEAERNVNVMHVERRKYCFMQRATFAEAWR